MMLCEIYEHLGVQGEVDPEFVRSALFKGQEWGLKRAYPGVFDDPPYPETISEVFDLLDMWRGIEKRFGRLADEERQRIEAEVAPFGGDVRFRGFDIKTELPHCGVAEFMICALDCYQEFKGRFVSANGTNLEAYRRMLPVYKSLEGSRSSREFGASDLLKILKAQKEPVLH